MWLIYQRWVITTIKTSNKNKQKTFKSIPQSPALVKFQPNYAHAYMIKRLIYDLFNIIPTIIPRPRVDIGVSGWYTSWYGKRHLLISILKISISSDIQLNHLLYLIFIVLSHLSTRKFKFSTWRTVTLQRIYFEFIFFPWK